MARQIPVGMATSLAAPLVILAALSVAIAGFSLPTDTGWTERSAPVVETVRIPRGWFDYEQPGEFTIDGRVASAPVEGVFVRGTLEVMKYQVATEDYAKCVADGVCAALDDGRMPFKPDHPVTGVSFQDAEAYAYWLSTITGETWRLPTDIEAAHYRMTDISARAGDGTGSFVSQWLAEYRENAGRLRTAGRPVQPLGAFGENMFGVADTSGNVWEWTSTCYAHIRLDNSGGERSRHENCGVRTLEGSHRAYLSVFIRDPVAGACAVGVPPDHLGIRLIRVRHWYDPIVKTIQRVVQLRA